MRPGLWGFGALALGLWGQDGRVGELCRAATMVPLHCSVRQTRCIDYCLIGIRSAGESGLITEYTMYFVHPLYRWIVGTPVLQSNLFGIILSAPPTFGLSEVLQEDGGQSRRKYAVSASKYSVRVTAYELQRTSNRIQSTEYFPSRTIALPSPCLASHRLP